MTTSSQMTLDKWLNGLLDALLAQNNLIERLTLALGASMIEIDRSLVEISNSIDLLR